MSEVFGFESISKDLEQYASRADHVIEKVIEEGEKMRDDARNIARGLGLYKTGKGVNGIEIEPTSNGVEIGWLNRPNFHLYFHEFGFHATGRKKGKRYTSRSSKGKRKRKYKSGTKYVPPKPHLRPAFDRGKDKFQNNIKKYIEGD
ncbi:hypothetical protein ACMFKE_04925 [Staphylococcus haemolyticus]|uniref:hypothetical protein n=1 Tax=Staphylococcus haemolyticus TaxID=1283 RepID=UPI0039BD7326